MGFKSVEKESLDCFLFQAMLNYPRGMFTIIIMHEVGLLPEFNPFKTGLFFMEKPYEK